MHAIPRGNHLWLGILALLLATTLGCGHGSRNHQGVFIGKTFTKVDIQCTPSSLTPGEETTVQILLSTFGNRNTIEGLVVNIDYRPPLYPVPERISVTVDSRPIDNGQVQTEISGGETLTLRVIIHEVLSQVEDEIRVTIPFIASTEMIPLDAMEIPLDVDIRVGNSMSPEIGQTLIEVRP